MPNAAQIKAFIVGHVIPVIAGALATWLTSSQVLNIFHFTNNQVAAAISQVLVFAVTTVLAAFTSHHILLAGRAGGGVSEKAYK